MARSMWEEFAEMDRPVSEFFRSMVPFGFRPWQLLAPGRPFAPSIDVYSRNGDLVVRIDLPGIDPEKDISVTYEPGELIVKGERKQEKEVKEDWYYRHEAVYGTFERHIPVPKETREADIKAEYKDGVLEVLVPHTVKPAEKPKAKQIAVKAPAKAVKA